MQDGFCCCLGFFKHQAYTAKEIKTLFQELSLQT